MDVAVETPPSKMSNSSGSPSSFGVRKRSSKSHKMLRTAEIADMGPSINDVASFEGGRGVQIDDIGRYEGGRCQKNTISSIQDFFENVTYFNVLKLNLWISPVLRFSKFDNIMKGRFCWTIITIIVIFKCKFIHKDVTTVFM